MFHGTKSQKLNLCKSCAIKAKKYVDKKNEELLNSEAHDTESANDITQANSEKHIDNSGIMASFSVYRSFFTKSFWKKIIDRIFLTLGYFHIFKKLVLISPLISTLLFLFDAAAIRLGWIALLASFILIFFTLTLDYDLLSLAAVIPNTIISAGMTISGILMYREPIILIFGLLSLAQVTMHWILLFKENAIDLTKIFIFYTFFEFISLFVFVIISFIFGAGFFFFFLSCIFFYLSQIIQLLVYISGIDELSETSLKRICSLGSWINSHCIEKERKYYELSQVGETVSKEQSTETNDIQDTNNMPSDVASDCSLNQDSNANHNNEEYMNDLGDAMHEYESVISNILDE